MSLPFGQVDLLGAILKAIDRLGIKGITHRQLNAITKAADDILAALRQEDRPAVPGMGLDAWLRSDATGQSSLYMAYVLVPLAGLGVTCPFPHYDLIPYPHDPSDFGRCVGLLSAVPELRPHLSALGVGHGPQWTALIAAWAELEALYVEELPSRKAPRLYKRMKELTKEAP